MIEAVELESNEHFVVGVQWHPERTYTTSAFSRAIFSAFTGAASNWQPRHVEESVNSGMTAKPNHEPVRGGCRPPSMRSLCGRAFRHSPASIEDRFDAYLSLIVRWNARTSLTAIRDEEGIVSRHFVESIACAVAVPAGVRTLLDFGSGAGFPGIPIALCRPEISVTLAESQNKKAAFLREAIRTLELKDHGAWRKGRESDDALLTAWFSARSTGWRPRYRPRRISCRFLAGS